jgi:hypothetical protein
MAKINEHLDPNNYSFRIEGHARICWAKNFFYIAFISSFFINPEHIKNISFVSFAISSILYTLGVKPVFKINTKNSVDHE